MSIGHGKLYRLQWTSQGGPLVEGGDRALLLVDDAVDPPIVYGWSPAASDWVALGGSGAGATNLSATPAPTQVVVASDTGTDATIPAADTTNAGVFLPAEKTKLAGVATGATVNSSDATLLARANHTGTQSADTLTDGTTNKAFLATERTKLAGVATGAQVNVLEGVTGTAPIVAGAIVAKSQALSITPATGSNPGSMSAADKTKLDGVATGAAADRRSALVLDYAASTDLFSGATASTASWQTLVANKSFTVLDTADVLTFNIGGAYTLVAGAGVIVIGTARVVIDSGGTPRYRYITPIVRDTSIYVPLSLSFALGGLAAGSHTIGIQYYQQPASGTSAIYLRAATDQYEKATIQVVRQ